MDAKAGYGKQGGLSDRKDGVCATMDTDTGSAGFRVLIVAMKQGNACGAKGHRKVDTEWAETRKPDRRQCPEWLNKPEKA
jgi:hypothetical protein